MYIAPLNSLKTLQASIEVQPGIALIILPMSLNNICSMDLNNCISAWCDRYAVNLSDENWVPLINV